MGADLLMLEGGPARRGLGVVVFGCERPERAKVSGDALYKLANFGEIRRDLFEDTVLERTVRRALENWDSELRPEYVLTHHNAYVNTGLTNSLQREFLAATGSQVVDIGVDCDTSAASAATTFLHGSANTPIPATTLNGAVSAGATTFVVASGSNIQVGMGFTIAAGGGTIESGVVSAIAGTTVTPVLALASNHNTGTAVSFIGQVIKAISPTTVVSAQTATGGATFVNSDFAIGGNNAPCRWNKIGFLLGATDNGSNLVDVIGGTGGTAPYNKTFAMDLTNVGTFSATMQIAVTAQAA